MELLPGERAVLNLIRALYVEAPEETHDLAVLRSRWPVAHDAAYTAGYVGLTTKGFIRGSSDGRSFAITEKGLDAIAARAVG